MQRLKTLGAIGTALAVAACAQEFQVSQVSQPPVGLAAGALDDIYVRKQSNGTFQSRPVILQNCDASTSQGRATCAEMGEAKCAEINMNDQVIVSQNPTQRAEGRNEAVALCGRQIG